MYNDLETGTVNSAGPNRQKERPLLHTIILVAILCISIAALVVAIQARNQYVRPAEIKEPGLVNLGPQKDAVRKYYTDGTYETDLIQLVQTYKAHFDTIHAKNNSLVIFDIDDTVLSNVPELLRADFGYIPKEFNAWVESANATAMEATFDFWKYLQQKGFKIFCITGRAESQREATLENFAKVGLDGEVGLILRSESEAHMSAALYKSQHRSTLVNTKGWDIVGCIGDQISDCVGGYTGYVMKLPNYAYFLP